MANQYNQVTGLSVVKVFGTASTSDVVVPTDAKSVLLQADTQAVRFRHDGTSPTASVGMRLLAGDAPIEISGFDAIRNLRVIEEVASAKLNVSFLVS